MTSAEMLSELRKTYSRRVLAEMTNLTQAKIANIEKGRDTTITEELAIRNAYEQLGSPISDPAVTPTPTSTPVVVTPPDPSLQQMYIMHQNKLRDPVTSDLLGNVSDPVELEPAEPVVLISPSDLTARDGIRRVSNSEITSFKRCRRQWWLSYYRGLRPRRESPVGPRAIGDRIHRALQRYYLPDSQYRTEPVAALEEVIREDWLTIKAAFAAQGAEVPELLVIDLNKQADLERAMIEGYVEWLKETGSDSEFHVLGSEQYIEADITTAPVSNQRVKLIGRLDVTVRRIYDNLRFFLDHKPQPLSAPILTPTGWTKIGELRVGDIICSEHGQPVRVTAVYDRGIDDVYEITLNDGTSVQATSDHPWMAKDTINGTWKITPTSDLKIKRHRLMNFTPRTDDVDAVLPIEPYALGAWLANGTRLSSEISDDVFETIAATNFRMRTVDRPDRKRLYIGVGGLVIKHALDELNLLHTYSKERFIPKTYIHAASYNQRLALLHGLLDGDGSLTINFSTIFITSSSRLADDVADLVRSLGAWAKIWKSPRPNHVGTMEDGYDTKQNTWTVSIRSTFNPFKHIDHAQRWSDRKQQVAGKQGTTSVDKIVKNVTHVGCEPVRCIEVDSTTHLYVTNGYTVSHNTMAEFTTATRLLPMNEQMKGYVLLHTLTGDPNQRIVGAIYNMMRRVKRTEKAKPPFYQRVEVQHNPTEIHTFRERTIGVVHHMESARRALDADGDHHRIVYPTPTKDCAWQCPFAQVCTLFDDGSRVEAALDNLFVVGDAYDYYAAPVDDFNEYVVG